MRRKRRDRARATSDDSASPAAKADTASKAEEVKKDVDA